ncbi:unnamed protein product, partial [Ilex paraguariensis]
YTKQMGFGSPPPIGSRSRKRTEEVGPSGGEQRKKRKNDPSTKNIKAKNMTFEQQVNRPTLRPHNDVV